MKSVTRALAALALLWMACTTGCMSARTTTDLKLQQDPALKSEAGMFYVAALKFDNSFRDAQVRAKLSEQYSANILPRLRQEAAASYPGLFSAEPSNAIPLAVNMRMDTNNHSGKTMAWMLCTLTVVGVIFPVPGQTDVDISLGVSTWTGRWEERAPDLQHGVRLETHAWVSLLTPLGLIPIPGESDFPKMSQTIFGAAGMQEVYYKQLAQMLATRLSQIVVEKDAAYWTTHAYEQMTPGSTSPAPATILPPPTNSAAPF